MLKFRLQLLLTLLMMCTSCNEVGNIMGSNILVNIKETKPVINTVKVQNDQFIITGKNLDGVTLAKIEGSTNHTFQIESKTADKIVINAKNVLNLLVGGTFDLILSNAQASATFPLSFELQNGQVTAAKLHHMGASTGEFLQFNGTSWGPASISTTQVYVGTYNAASDTPNISSAVAAAGTYYIVTTAGAQDLGTGLTTFDVGDWVISDGTSWSKVAVGTNTVSNFNGRTGAVVPLSGDYSWSMLTKAAGKLTGSKLQEIADIDAAGIQDGDILQWNAGTSKWEVNAVPAPVINAGSISNSQIANGAIDSTKIVDGSIVNADISATAAIDQSKINGLTTALTNKEPSITAGTAAQYWSGNKTWQNLNPAVIGSTLTGFTSTTGAVTAADSILSALQKISGNTGTVGASLGNYVLKAGDTMSGPLAMGSNKITGLATPTVATDAANKDYVDTQITGASLWTKTGSDIYYSLGKVGFGLSTLASDMHVQIEDRLTNSNGRSINADLRQHSSLTGNYSLLAGVFKAQTTLDAGVTNSGTLNGVWSVAFRNNLVGTLDNGTLASIRANYIQYGHYDSEAAATPQTTDVHGLYLSPYYKKGTITNLYDIFVHPGSPGGTVTNYYGLHLAGTNKKHYLEGNLGINVLNPTEKIHVSGNIALDGKVRFKSDNANFVELRAPAGLAGTVAFNLPGTAGTSGQALTTDGAGNLSWSTVASGTPANGSIDYAKLNLADGDIPLAKLAGTSDATKYLKGDKSWGTFLTDVLASTFATVTPSNTAIANGDSLQTVINKTQGQFNNLATNSLNKTGSDSVTGTLTINPATGALKIPATPSGVDLTDAANVQYVQNFVDTFGKWLKSGSNIYFNTGNVGIGTTSTTGPAGVETQLKILRPLNKWGLMIEGDGTNQSDILLHTPNNTANNRVGQMVNVADKLIFRALNDDMTQKTQLMTMLLNSGYVGVGTATPLRPFHVTQSAAAGGNTAPMMIQRVNTSGTPAADELTVVQFNLPNSAGTGIVGADFGATLTDVTPGSEKGAIVFRTSANGGSTIPEKMRIDSSGNVGIGITTPTAKLHVKDSVDSILISQVENASNGTAASVTVNAVSDSAGIGLEAFSSTFPGNWGTVPKADSVSIRAHGGSPPANMIIGTSTAVPLHLMTASSPRMTVSATGMIGIGTTAPAFPLDIKTSGATFTRLGTDSVAAVDVGTYYFQNNLRRWAVFKDSTAESGSNVGSDFRLNRYADDGSLIDVPFIISRNKGNVGIGTILPAYKLQVQKTATATPALMIGGGFSGGPRIQTYGLDQNPLAFMGLGSDMSGDPYDHSIYTSGPVQNGKITFGQYDGTTFTERMRVNGDGNVGIGVTTPGYKLHVNGSVAGVGAYNALSDRRLKKDFEKIPDALERIVALNGFYYKWRQGEHPEMEFEKGRDMGVIAQEVKKVFPEAVSTNKKSGIMSVAYSKLIAPIIEAIKELFTESNKQKREIAALKEKNRILEQKVETFEQRLKALESQRPTK